MYSNASFMIFSGVCKIFSNGIKINLDKIITAIVTMSPITIEPATDFFKRFLLFAP